MRSPAAAGTDRSRLLLAVGAAAFSIIGVAMVMLAAFVLLALGLPRLTWLATGGSGGIGSISAGLSIGIVTVLMLLFVATAAFVAVRVFRMVRAGTTATD